MIGRSFSLFFSIFFSRCCTRIIGHVLHGNLKVQNAFTVVVFKGFCVLFFKCIYFILLIRFVILLLVVKIFFSIVIYILLTIKCFFDIFWVAAKTLITPTQYRHLRRLPYLRGPWKLFPAPIQLLGGHCVISQNFWQKTIKAWQSAIHLYHYISVIKIS